MGRTVTVDLGVLSAFGAGLVSFMSPCILPLVPPYLCFLAGTSLNELTAEAPRGLVWRVLGRATAFVAGFACVFVALGASASVIGQLVSDHLTLLSRISGAVLVVLGLHMAGAFRWSLLMREARFSGLSKPVGPFGAFVIGLAFGFGWTPCVGPILTSILLLAGAETTVGRGAGLLAAYAAGIGVPFLAAALFTGSFLRFAERWRGRLAVIEVAMGLVLVGVGVLIFTGAMPVIGAWLQEHVPVLGRIG
jgi:cytochrome c-type biogenesis protein